MINRKVGYKTEGVGYIPTAKEQLRSLRNSKTLKSSEFLTACAKVGVEGIPPTKRQASKWNNKKGAAYKFSH